MSNQAGIDLIVTDLGGTLVKTDGAIMAAVRRAAGELEIPEGYADPVYDVFGTSIWEYIHAYLPEGHKDRTNDCHERFWQLFPYEVLDQIAPFAGVEEALHDLKRRGVRIAVLSGLRLESIESILSGLSFKDWDTVRSSMMYSTASGDSRAIGIVGPGQGVRRLPRPDDLHRRHGPRRPPGQKGRRPLRRRQDRRPGRPLPPQDRGPKPTLSPRLLRRPL